MTQRSAIFLLLLLLQSVCLLLILTICNAEKHNEVIFVSKKSLPQLQPSDVLEEIGDISDISSEHLLSVRFRREFTLSNFIRFPFPFLSVNIMARLAKLGEEDMLKSTFRMPHFAGLAMQATMTKGYSDKDYSLLPSWKNNLWLCQQKKFPHQKEPSWNPNRTFPDLFTGNQFCTGRVNQKLKAVFDISTQWPVSFQLPDSSYNVQLAYSNEDSVENENKTTFIKIPFKAEKYLNLNLDELIDECHGTSVEVNCLVLKDLQIDSRNVLSNNAWVCKSNNGIQPCAFLLALHRINNNGIISVAAYLFNQQNITKMTINLSYPEQMSNASKVTIDLFCERFQKRTHLKLRTNQNIEVIREDWRQIYYTPSVLQCYWELNATVKLAVSEIDEFDLMSSKGKMNVKLTGSANDPTEKAQNLVLDFTKLDHKNKDLSKRTQEDYSRHELSQTIALLASILVMSIMATITVVLVIRLVTKGDVNENSEEGQSTVPVTPAESPIADAETPVVTLAATPAATPAAAPATTPAVTQTADKPPSLNRKSTT